MTPMVKKVVTLLALATTPGFSGCFLFRTSPIEYGLDLRLAPGFRVGDGRVTVHPTAAYGRTVFGGVDGESDDFIHLGGQVRLSSPSSGDRGPGVWFGAEATYARRWTGFDAPGLDTEATNGWTVAGLAGLPIVEGSVGTLHGYVAGGVIKYGGSGPYFRLGLDFQPAFLTR